MKYIKRIPYIRPIKPLPFDLVYYNTNVRDWNGFISDMERYILGGVRVISSRTVDTFYSDIHYWPTNAEYIHKIIRDDKIIYENKDE